MNPKTFNTEAVRQLLNRSTRQIGPLELERLRAARMGALEHYDARVATAPAFAWAGLGHFGFGARHSKSYYWAGAVLLAACLFGTATYWQQMTEHDNSDVDIAILTDDLPMDAYVE
jgi:hypothetical protein